MPNNDEFFKKYGYTEMYEWNKIPSKPHGLFVTFNSEKTDKIEPYHDNNSYLLGVTTTCSACISDDPQEWSKAYIANEVDDLYLDKETLAVGVKQYDQHLEMSYIKTQPYTHYIKIPNKTYNKDAKYIKRTSRKEWTKVNLEGKVVVRDFGDCVPGSYCKPYVGDDESKFGYAVPAKPTDSNKFYILKRITTESVMIVNK